MPNTTNEQMNKKARLGRGLGSLLGEQKINAPEVRPSPAVAPAAAPVIANDGTKVWQIPVEKLAASSFQPRNHFAKEPLEELANSIKTQGILQPIVARKIKEGQFEIIAGERRWRAAQLAGLREVPVIIKALSNRETLELAIIENVQREDLNPVEEAEAYQRLAEEFNLTQAQVAEKVGKERATVANAMRLLGLPQEVRNKLSDGAISAGHAKVLLSVQDPKLINKLAQKIQDEGLSVRQLEKVIRAYKNLQGADAKTEKEPTQGERQAQHLAEELQKLWGRKVQIDYSEGRGKVSVHFYSVNELNDIADRMRDACKN